MTSLGFLNNLKISYLWNLLMCYLYLQKLSNENNTKFSYDQLLIESENVEQTKTQVNSNLLFRLRFSRMTASNIRNVCKINSHRPSVSILKQTYCWTKFRSDATDCVCEHEHMTK